MEEIILVSGANLTAVQRLIDEAREGGEAAKKAFAEANKAVNDKLIGGIRQLYPEIGEVSIDTRYAHLGHLYLHVAKAAPKDLPAGVAASSDAA